MNLIKKCRYGLMIYNTKDFWIGRSISLYGEFSESEVQLFAECISPGMVVIDVGANIGYHTIAFARIVGPNGFVFGYEPERMNFCTLAGNVAINNLHNVYVYNQAVGNHSGFIQVPELDHALTENFGGVSLNVDYTGAKTYQVPLIKLDDQNFERCDFIKMDIEGMEKIALEGSLSLIEKYKPILYIEDDRPEQHVELLKLIKSLGYIVYKHDAIFYNPENFFANPTNVFYIDTTDGKSNFVSGNLFCHHQSVPCPIDVTKHNMQPM